MLLKLSYKKLNFIRPCYSILQTIHALKSFDISRKTEIIYYIFCETAFSRNFANLIFANQAVGKIQLTYIFASQIVGKLTLAKFNDLKVKGLFSLSKYKQDYITIKSYLKLFYRY